MAESFKVDKSQLLKNTLYNSFAQAFSVISVFVFTPLLLSSFGRLQFGLYTLAASIVASLALLDFGVGQSLTADIAKDDAVGNQHAIQNKMRGAYQLYGAIGIVVALSLIILGFFSEQLFNVDVYEGLSLSTLLYVSAGIQFFFWPLQTARHILAGLKDFKTVSISTLYTVMFTIVAMALTLLLQRVVLTALVGVALLFGQMRNSFVLLKILRLRRVLILQEAGEETLKTTPSTIEAKTPLAPIIRSLIMAGLPLFVIQVTGTLIHEQTDRVVLGIILGGVAVATYELGAKFSIMFGQLIALGVSAVLPVVSNLESQKDNDRMCQLFLRGSRYLAFLLFPIAAVLMVFADTILFAWLGNVEPQAALVMRLLIAAQFFVPLYVLSDSILIAQKRFRYWITVALFIAALNIAASVILVNIFGVVGAAAGTFIASIIEFPLLAWYILHVLGFRLDLWLKGSFIPATLALVIPVIFGLVAKPILSQTPFLSVLVIGTFMLLLYWGFIYGVILKDWEKNQLRGFIEKSFRK